MTFLDRRVAEAVGKSFVAAWVNRGPGFRNAEFGTESWIFKGDLEAYPTKNICTFFLSPKGKVFHYLAGSYAPEVFLKELEAAVALREALFDASMDEKGGLAAAAKLRRARADAYEDQADEARTSPQAWAKFAGDPKKALLYRGLKHQHGPGCLRSLANGWDYFAKLHRMWAEMKELPDLEAVRYAYLYGNDFTEESQGSTPVVRQDPAPAPPPPPRNGRVKPAGSGDALGLGLPTLNVTEVLAK